MLAIHQMPKSSGAMRSLRLNPGVHHSGDGLSLVKPVERCWSGLGGGAATGATISAPQEKQNRLSATGTAAPHRIQNLAGWDTVHLF